MSLYTLEDIIEMAEKENLFIDVDLKTVDPDKKLTLQGVDSLDFASILFGIENHFKVKVENESVAKGEWSTINKVLSKLNALGR